MDKKYYTDEKNAQIVLALLKAHGIKKIVASPGATNIPITGSIQNDPWFQVVSAPDERSAAYIACGLSAESGETVVLSCTGATASRNYLPGLTEAYYRKLPVLAITSMPAFSTVGNLVPQSIDRSMQPRDAVKLSVFVPVVKDTADFESNSLLVNRAILETLHHGGGPVHINLETSYKGTFNTRELPKVVRISRITSESTEWPTLDTRAKVAVFIGAHKPFSQSQAEALEAFVGCHNAVVFCDHTSAYKGAGRMLGALACSQKLSAKSEYRDLKPDLIIHIGEISGDYPTQSFLSCGVPVWRVSEDGEIRDRFKRLECVFEMSESYFFHRYAEETEPRENTYLQDWTGYEEKLHDGLPELPFSNAWIAQTLAPRMPKGSVIHFGILNSLRCWNLFEFDSSIDAACNVGGFGIDGCVSTLIGASLADSSRLHFGVVGDLAFFYDLNSLGNRHVGKNLRILLINNGGGGEFKLYSHIGSQFEEQTDDFIAAGRHYGNKSPVLARHYAEDLGFEYLCANGKDEFDRVVGRFVDPAAQDKPILFECFTNLQDDSDALELLEHLDASVSTEVAARRLAGKYLPSSVKGIIKKALGK